MLDDRDLQILSILQDDARTSNAEIGRRIGIAPSAVLERIRKLERRGVIRGYAARIDPRAVGRNLLAYVFVQANEGPGDSDLGASLAQVPEVQEVHHVAGEDCYLIKVRCGSPEELGLLLRARLGPLPEVLRTRSTIVLGTIKDEGALDLGQAGSEESHDES